jgi:hypothetical protein
MTDRKAKAKAKATAKATAKAKAKARAKATTGVLHYVQDDGEKRRPRRTAGVW